MSTTNFEKNEWFATWFDSPYYHKLYGNRNVEEARLFVSNLAEYLELNKNSKVLDMACGKGRHAKALLDYTSKVVGYDLSENSIIYARKEINGAEFRVHDMRKPFPDNEFDAILNLFTSFGYFNRKTENIDVLFNVANSLTNKGRLIIDFMNAEKAIQNLIPNEIITANEIKFKIDRSFDGEVITKFIQFDDSGKCFEFNERVQALKMSDFEALLTLAGFKIIDTFGDYQLGPFDVNKSDRLIIAAQLI